MRHLILVLLISFGIGIQAQTIDGTIFDAKTGVPIVLANVYYSGTFVGTISDSLGRFSLDASAYFNHAFVVSAIGYYSETITQYSTTDSVRIRLKPKTFSISQVDIVYNRSKALRDRKKNLNTFEKAFIGNNYNARKTKILNPEDIYFENEKAGKDVIAYALKPIQIKNASLGYTLTYHLDSFSQTKETIYYSGIHFFMEDSLQGKRKVRKMLERRREAYLGSRMHFIRTLYAQQTGKAGFILLDSLDQTFEPDSLVYHQDLDIGFFQRKGIVIYCFYPDKSNLLSFEANYVHILTDSLLITRYGYYDPNQATWSGKTAKERIGNLLPYEFALEKDTPSP